MSERKVLNKYYPPDFDPSKIPRARCPRNRQFTVRLMVPCNIKCYTCGEYIAKGKKFNARKEDVENMTYLGVRIYRFYIKCPGCLAEISFRTDPESTDYVIEAGAHRNFQALKLAEEQAAREEREAKEEIESNPMLLLENRTQQSQYEMEVLESLEDLRDMNERHAGIDLGKITERYEAERKMTQEQREEAEKLEALKALGYEMIEGQMIKRIAIESDSKSLAIAPAEKHNNNSTLKKNTMKSKLTGLIKTKSSNQGSSAVTICGSKDATEEVDLVNKQDETNDSTASSNSSIPSPNLSSKSVSALLSNKRKFPETSTALLSDKRKVPETSNGVAAAAAAPKALSALSFLGAYSDSESDGDST